MSPNIKVMRRVLAQLINSHQHVEMVEIQTLVRASGGFGTEAFEADLQHVEAVARTRLVTAREDADDFSMVGVLCAVTMGPYRGRIVWVKQAEMQAGEPTW